MISLSQEFVTGLLASVNQIELSLDRAQSTKELTAFFTTDRIQVVRELTSRLRRRVGTNGAVRLLPRAIQWYVCGRLLLPPAVVEKLIVALAEFIDFLSGVELNATERIRLRLNFAEVATSLEAIVPARDTIHRTRAVTHVNQASHLDLRDIEAICGEGWSTRA